MVSQRHERISEVFLAVCELPAEERAKALHEQCADDPSLRSEVEALLARDAEDDSAFLQSPALGEGFSVQRSAAGVEAERSLVGKRISHYHLTRVIASGGMGTVYEAQQDEPRRTLAVKVMKRGITSPSALKRFEYESQILAHLHHPGIAHVYEAGRYEEGGDVPYFAMEFIADAKPITDYAKGRKINTRQRLDLFIKVCDAVHHGHQKGVIHRDLKPSNILVDGQGEPKVIDFGVARATDSDIAITTLQTDVGQLIGTLQYMSPEQCEGHAHDLDTRSDVYSLGVVLYELLCDQVPYDVSSGTVPQAIQVIREETPVRPSTINRTLRGDLETITLKALEKERQRRYDSAAALADDIRRYLNDEPIIARPASAIYQFRKFARRNRGLVAGLSVAVLALVVATGVSIVFAMNEAEARATAEQKNTGLKAVNEFMGGIFQAANPNQARGREVTLREALDQASISIDDEFNDTPLVEATIRTAIGSAYINLGNYELSHTHYQAAVDIRRKLLGDENADTADAVVGMANAAAYLGRMSEAIDLLTEAVGVYRRTRGDLHEDVIKTQNYLVMVLHADGQDEEAVAIAEEVVANAHLVPRGHDYEDGFAGAARNNLAMALHGVGRYGEAAVIYRDLYEEATKDGPSDHPGVIAIMNNLGELLRTMGREDEAMEIMSKTLEAANRVFSPDHGSAMRVLNNYIGLLRHFKRYEEAESLTLDLLERRQRVLGPENPMTVSSMQGLAVIYQDMPGRLEEAEPYLHDALAIYQATIGDDHPRAMVTRNSLAVQYRRTGRYEESEALYKENIELSRRVNGNDHPDTLHYIRSYATLLILLERYEEAEEHLLASIPPNKPFSGSTNAATRKLAQLYDAWGKPGEAAQWRAKLPDEVNSNEQDD